MIYKYELSITDGPQTIHLSGHSEPLKVAEQNGKLLMWVQTCTDCELEPWVFRVSGTGHEIDNELDLVHIDTVLMSNGLVWHVFEDITPVVVDADKNHSHLDR